MACLLAGCAALPAETPANLVSSVIKAPVTPDGDVAGRATDLVVNFDVPYDPAVRGRTLEPGRSIRITLPPEFVDSGEVPFLPYASDPRCGPQRLACSTAALLQGWPQSPVPFDRYSVRLERGRTIVLTAREEIGYRSEFAPGIKAVHLLLHGFRNPQPGRYPLVVEAETGPGGAIEHGRAEVQIAGRSSPSIQVTSVFDQPASLPKTVPPTRASTLYQVAAPGAAAPIAYNFLLWDSAGAPMTGVVLERIGGTESAYRLLRGPAEVGTATIDAPPGATGHRLVASAPSAAISAPVSLVPAARLRVQFTAGSVAGEYRVAFALHGGNRQELRIRVLRASAAT